MMIPAILIAGLTHISVGFAVKSTNTFCSKDQMRQTAQETLLSITSGKKSFDAAYASQTCTNVSYQSARTFTKDTLPAELSDVWKSKPNVPILREGYPIQNVTKSYYGSFPESIRGMYVIAPTKPVFSVTRYEKGEKVLEILSRLEPSAKYESFSGNDANNMQEPIVTALSKMKNGEVGKVTLSNGKVALILRKNFTSSSIGMNFTAAWVCYGVPYGQAPSSAKKESAYARIQSITDALKKGVSPQDIYKKEATNNATTFSMKSGIQTPDNLYPEIATVVFKLKQGEISSIIDTNSCYFIYRREADRPSFTSPIASFSQLTFSGTSANKVATKYLRELQTTGLKVVTPTISVRYLYFPLEGL